MFLNINNSCDPTHPEKCKAPWVKGVILETNTIDKKYKIQYSNGDIVKDFPEVFIRNDKSLWLRGPPSKKPSTPYNRCSPGITPDKCLK